MSVKMKKKTSNNLIILLLAVFTIVVAISLLISININEFLAVSLGIIGGLGLYLTYLRKQKPIKKKSTVSLKSVSNERKKLYLSKGLSNEDIDFFRETMNNTKEQILLLEDNINQTGKLRAIANRHDTLNLVKILFKDIVNEPDRLHEVDQFLYVHLPSLTELTSKYVQINQHKAKSKQTFDILEKSAETIDGMCLQISDDYLQFRSRDIKDLANEVELAKKRLNREGSSIKDDEI